MRTPPSVETHEGDGARLPVRRSEGTPPSDGEPLLDHLADRLSVAERELRAARAAVAVSNRHRDVLGTVTRLLGAHPETPALALIFPALPALGSWCMVEEITGDHVARAAAVLDDAQRDVASALSGSVKLPVRPGGALARAFHAGRIERMEAAPESLGDGEAPAIREALVSLARGPVMFVPVVVHGRVTAALVFGRPAGAASYDDADQRLASELAALVALGLSHRRTTAAAESAARAKTEFLTMMSHELRTPLNAIAGYAQLLEMGFRGALNDDQRDAVNRIIRGQEHLLELVDGVLTFSRLTSGHLPLGEDTVAASAIMDVASESLVKEFASRGIDFRLEQCGPDVRVHADRERCVQVIRQLLGNALKFTPQGGSVRLQCEAAEGLVRFTVTDTGRGIPAAHHESIFHPFVQVEQGLTRSADGSGLGLAISRELAERMGGALTVRSESGAGSAFVLTLPGACDPGKTPPDSPFLD